MPKTAPRSAALGHQGPQTEQPSIASPDAALQRDKPRTRSESGVRHAQERRFWGEQRGWFRERQQDCHDRISINDGNLCVYEDGE